MMLGIRVAVGRPQQMDDLTLMDFMQVDKYLFPPKGKPLCLCSTERWHGRQSGMLWRGNHKK
jgi:hypothetical protein